MRRYSNRRQPFRVEGIYEGNASDFDIANKTLHARERGSRSDFIARMSKGSDVRLDRMFIVDKGHKNGLEVHAVYSNAVINIFNLNDKKYITSLIGRPGQIRRYYNDIGERPPREILDMAYENYNRGYNRSDFNYEYDMAMNKEEENPPITGYQGIFLAKSCEDNLKENLPNIGKFISDMHITFNYGELSPYPVDYENKLIFFEVVGYANDGKNVGLSVKVPNDLSSWYTNKAQPHITVSLSDGAKAVDTGKMEFEPLSETCLLIGYLGYGVHTEKGFRKCDTFKEVCDTVGADYSKVELKEPNAEPEFEISSDLLCRIYGNTQDDVYEDEQSEEPEVSPDDDLSR